MLSSFFLLLPSSLEVSLLDNEFLLDLAELISKALLLLVENVFLGLDSDVLLSGRDRLLKLVHFLNNFFLFLGRKTGGFVPLAKPLNFCLDLFRFVESLEEVLLNGGPLQLNGIYLVVKLVYFIVKLALLVSQRLHID